jgi:hypothetical protein
MREFKPMVKMETTEPTVELKLKKGGAVEKRMAGGGAPMGAMVGAPKGGMMAGAKPKKPSLAARRRAMMASGAAGAPSGRAEAMMAAMPAMKKGGEMESSKVHKAEMKELSGIKKKLTKHEDMPASKGHRGLKTGGVVNGNGGFKAGGSVSGSCGYKTGGVAMANAGGFRKGGAVKKFAEGGRVQHDGGPEQMKQGKKKPASPVSINQLSGTYKKGGAVMMANGGVTKLGTSIVNKPLADNNTAARKAAEQKAIADRANARKPAAINPAVNASQLAMEKRRADQVKASVAASQSRAVAVSQSRAAAAANPKPVGLDPKTGRFAPGSMEYKGPQVTVSMSMPRPQVPKREIEGLNPVTGRFDPNAPETVRQVPSVPPGRPSGPTPMPVFEDKNESTAYRRGGKVQNNGKNRGGAVC